MTSSTPTSSATASATSLASPVIITTRTPSRCRARTASTDSGRISSSTATAPTMRPSRTTLSTVAPRAPLRDLFGDLGRHVDPTFTQERGSANLDRRSVHDGFDAASWQSPEVRRARDRTVGGCCGDDRLRKWMLAASLDRAVVGASLKGPLVPTLRLDATSPMEHIVSALNDFQPESLVAYAGMAKALALEQLDGRLPQVLDEPLVAPVRSSSAAP